MKIMTQNREMIIEQPRQVWVTPIVLGDDGEGSDDARGYIMCNVQRNPELGEYKSVTRAKEVLAELFEAQRRGKANYYMPRE